MLFIGLAWIVKGQCPDFAIMTPNMQCVGLLWLEGEPDPPPDTIFIGEATYVFTAGINLPGAGIVYTLNGIGNSNPFVCLQIPENFTGTIWIEGDQCDFEDGALPVSLVRFEASTQGAHVRLEWETSYEYQNKSFIVERSADGLNWTSVATLPGRGNADYVSDYEATDFFPVEGTSLYRLKSVDYDGNEELSEIRSVQFNSIARVYPNPASDHLTIRGEYTLYDSMGRLVRTGADERVDVSHLSRGMYVVRVGGTALTVVLED